MPTFAQKSKATRLAESERQTMPGLAFSRQCRDVHAIFHLQRTIGNRAVQRLLNSKLEKPEVNPQNSTSPAFARATSSSETPAHPQSGGVKTECRTGMAPSLKAGLEAFSGMDLSGVRVHINSSKPAQLDALAYTQEQDIHVGPGQEAHLPHEGWHVVQQMQGRVKPMVQTKGVSINDDEVLEREADVMGAKALQMTRENQATISSAWEGASSVRRSVPAMAKSIHTNGSKPDTNQRQGNKQSNTSPDRPIVQRYANCFPPRLSGRKCPSRTKRERQIARNGPMVFLPQLVITASGEKGVLIANFDIGNAAIKPSLLQTIYWQQFLTEAQTDRKKWRIEGFSDCQGSETANQSLREQRAKAVLSILPTPLRTRITSTAGASSQNCITENSTAGERTLNRSVALLLVESTYDFTGNTIEGHLERDEPDTDGCSKNQKDRLSIAYPLARRMGEKAKATIPRMKRGSPDEALLQKFFGSRAFDRRWRIHQGYTAALGAITGGPTYKCVPQGTEPCESPTTSGFVGAHAIIFGNPVVVCDYGFNNADNIELADTILHEASHVGNLTNDLEYCSRSRGCSLDTTDEILPGIRLTDRGALNNADSYARFASELFRR